MAKRQPPEDKSIPLTKREMQVLRHLALGLSNREIGSSLSITRRNSERARTKYLAETTSHGSHASGGVGREEEPRLAEIRLAEIRLAVDF